MMKAPGSRRKVGRAFSARGDGAPARPAGRNGRDPVRSPPQEWVTGTLVTGRACSSAGQGIRTSRMPSL